MIEEVTLNPIDLAASWKVNWSNYVEHIINVVLTEMVPDSSQLLLKVQDVLEDLGILYKS